MTKRCNCCEFVTQNNPTPPVHQQMIHQDCGSHSITCTDNWIPSDDTVKISSCNQQSNVLCLNVVVDIQINTSYYGMVNTEGMVLLSLLTLACNIRLIVADMRQNIETYLWVNTPIQWCTTIMLFPYKSSGIGN